MQNAGSDKQSKGTVKKPVGRDQVIRCSESHIKMSWVKLKGGIFKVLGRRPLITSGLELGRN